MIINHNLGAMNAHRQMGVNNTNSNKAMEKLSSGLRINKAGDDAAGLAISEKMRGQIRGLDQASKNAQDGISLIQTAEGALNETHSILQRMNELATQSSNDTNVGIDRDAIQKEMDELAKEISRISSNTEFNEQKLLDGKFTDKKFHIGANGGQNISLSISGMSAEDLNVIGYTKETAVATDLKINNRSDKDYTISTVALGTDAVETTTATIDEEGNVTIKLAQAAVEDAANAESSATFADVAKALKAIGIDATVTAGKETDSFEVLAADVDIAEGVKDVNSGINVSTQQAADASIETIQAAIDRVSTERSLLGANQNRLEHTINNLSTSSENLTAAESRVRDVDMAKEMMNFSKNNILSQASQAMLAQANQQPQQVLQLLR